MYIVDREKELTKIYLPSDIQNTKTIVDGLMEDINTNISRTIFLLQGSQTGVDKNLIDILTRMKIHTKEVSSLMRECLSLVDQLEIGKEVLDE